MYLDRYKSSDTFFFFFWIGWWISLLLIMIIQIIVGIMRVWFLKSMVSQSNILWNNLLLVKRNMVSHSILMPQGESSSSSSSLISTHPLQPFWLIYLFVRFSSSFFFSNWIENVELYLKIKILSVYLTFWFVIVLYQVCSFFLSFFFFTTLDIRFWVFFIDWKDKASKVIWKEDTKLSTFFSPFFVF